jgi:hypothetical protein
MEPMISRPRDDAVVTPKQTPRSEPGRFASRLDRAFAEACARVVLDLDRLPVGRSPATADEAQAGETQREQRRRQSTHSGNNLYVGAAIVTEIFSVSREKNANGSPADLRSMRFDCVSAICSAVALPRKA